MKYELTDKLLLKSEKYLVIGIHDDHDLPTVINDCFTPEHKVTIKRLAAKLTKEGDILTQADMDGASLMLIHCGSQTSWDLKKLRKCLNNIITELCKQHVHHTTIHLPKIPNVSCDRQLEQMIVAIEASKYTLCDFKSKDKQPSPLESINIHLPGAKEKIIQSGKAIASGIDLARNLANFPANICTPTYLAEQAIKLADMYPNISTTILELEEIQKLKMGAFLAVAQGSKEPLKFIEIQYHGNPTDKNAAPIVLVGKGVTFDAGGISLKPANGMNEMKYDMGGAASVFGALKACAELALPLNVIGLIPATENMPGGQALKPGDIVTSMSEQTIEIMNTDAEGRLILADALTYAERFKPSIVLDIATLTGAMVVALGNVYSGFMTQDDALAEMVIEAARESEDQAWRMPLVDDYQEAMDSTIADMVNASFDRGAGSITAACFLARFAKQYRWVHFDIAGTAWISGKQCNATGRPVYLLTQLLRHASTNKS